MWRFTFLLLIILGFNLFEIVGQSHSGTKHAMDELIDAEKKGFSYKAFQENDLTSSYDVKYYGLELTVNPEVRFVEGKVTVYFVPNQDISQIVFDLSSSLVVDSVLSVQQGTFSHSQDVIVYHQNFSAGVFDSLIIYYHGEPDVSSTSFVQDSHNGTPIIWTLSEPYGALEWWPCKQSLTDKADSIDMYVTTPIGFKVAGNGNLISEIIVDTLQITHWSNRYPIVPYLVAFAVTDYSEVSFHSTLTTGNLMVQNYVYKEDSALVLNELQATDTLLRLYDSLVGPYPFMTEKYGHAQFGRGGGMEHQTMSFMNHFGFSLNAHELAHQWFGDKITCGSWSDLWLNEGFATYFTGIAYENLRNDSLWMEWKRAVLEEVVSEPGGSVYVLDTADVVRLFDSRLTYRKGAYVLHMLRFQVEDDVFFEAVRNYLTDPDLAYKTAKTDDFFKHIENLTGADFTWFKNEWIYGQGYPSYNFEWEQSGTEFRSTLTQTTSHSSVSFFHNRVPILLTNANGDSVYFETTPQEPPSTSVFPVNFEVENVIIDPNLDIISKGNFTINKQILSGFKIYPNPVSTILEVVPGNDLARLKSYQVYSSEGKLVLSDPDFNQFQNSSIDVSKLPHGVYTLIFHGTGEDVIQKFVVSR